jgi:hypothetical protein
MLSRIRSPDEIPANIQPQDVRTHKRTRTTWELQSRSPTLYYASWNASRSRRIYQTSVGGSPGTHRECTQTMGMCRASAGLEHATLPQIFPAMVVVSLGTRRICWLCDIQRARRCPLRIFECPCHQRHRRVNASEPGSGTVCLRVV